MTETTSRQFGLIVAYLLPGFIALAGVAPLVPMVADWLRPANLGQLDIAAPVYAIMAATAMGMIVSCFRWLIIDRIHERTGLAAPAWRLDRLGECLTAFNYIVEGNYRYYQFYSNTIVAIAWSYLVNRFLETSSLLSWGTDLGVLILCAVLFAGSRDALAKYYTRTGQLVGLVENEDNTMTNGFHPESETKPSKKTEATNKAQLKPASATKPAGAEVKQGQQAK